MNESTVEMVRLVEPLPVPEEIRFVICGTFDGSLSSPNLVGKFRAR